MVAAKLTRRALAAALPLAALPPGAPAAPQGAAPQALTGWREAILIVPQLAPWVEMLTTVGGWEPAHHSAPDATLNALWALPPSALTEQILMRDINTRTGYIRLVHASGAPQSQIRPDDQAWDTGGIQALDLRVADITATRAALHARGWRAPSDPVRYNAYGFEDIQWAPVSPDGIRLSFIQRITPPLAGWPALKRFSHATNAAVTVSDMPAAEKFFGRTLGLKAAFSSHQLGANGPNTMGLPYTVARTLPVDIQGYAGGGKDGSVELIAMPQAQGREFSKAAHPPNLGIAGLRYFVPNAAAELERLAKAGIPLSAALQKVELAPYGPCAMFAVSGPDGVWIEMTETA